VFSPDNISCRYAVKQVHFGNTPCGKFLATGL